MTVLHSDQVAQDPAPTSEALARLGIRVGEAVAALRMSQNEFAARVGTSGSYLSDVVRGLKKPGSEFLAALSVEFGISIDWIVVGRGSMFGRADIDLNVFRVALAMVRLARAAVSDGLAESSALARAILSDAPFSSQVSETFAKFVSGHEPDGEMGEDAAIAAAIYNKDSRLDDPHTRLREMLRSAMSLFELKRGVDPLAAMYLSGVNKTQPHSGRDSGNSRAQTVRNFKANVVNNAAGDVVQYGPQVVHQSTIRTGRARSRKARRED